MQWINFVPLSRHLFWNLNYLIELCCPVAHLCSIFLAFLLAASSIRIFHMTAVKKQSKLLKIWHSKNWNIVYYYNKWMTEILDVIMPTIFLLFILKILICYCIILAKLFAYNALHKWILIIHLGNFIMNNTLKRYRHLMLILMNIHSFSFGKSKIFTNPQILFFNPQESDIYIVFIRM